MIAIHGGGWQSGEKTVPLRELITLVKDGRFAGVSVNYRLSSEAIWPAQIHDCKAAVRWVRANAAKYGFDTSRIAVMGSSAGGMLASMLGVTGGNKELEGTVGPHLAESSQVHCVVDQYGPAELLTMGGAHNQSNSAESKLVGGTLPDHPDAARSASVVTHVSKNAPPFLIVQGDLDPVVRYSQSVKLRDKLRELGVPVYFVTMTGGGHGQFQSPELAGRIRAFLEKYLLGAEVTINESPLAAGARRQPGGL